MGGLEVLILFFGRGCGFRKVLGQGSSGGFSRGCGSRSYSGFYPGGRGVIGTNFFGGARKLGSGVPKGACGFRKFWGFYPGGYSGLGTKFVMIIWKNRYIEIVKWDEFRTGVSGSLMGDIRISDPNFGIMRGVT